MSDKQTVYIARGWSAPTKKYHITDTDCPAARKCENLRETTKEQAEAHGFEQCHSCTRDYDTSNYDQSYQDALKQAAESD